MKLTLVPVRKIVCKNCIGDNTVLGKHLFPDKCTICTKDFESGVVIQLPMKLKTKRVK